METKYLIKLLEDNRRGAKTAGLSKHEASYEKALDEAYGLLKALDIAIFFIDGLGEARLKENLGRDAMDAILKQMPAVLVKAETDNIGKEMADAFDKIITA